MSTSARGLHHTYEEYLRLEEHAATKHEYWNGEIYAMAGGTPDHAALAAAVIRILGSQLRAGCRAYTSDLRVRITATGLSTYPDAAVVCGPTERAEDDHLAVINPVLLVEVTSSSTEDYDRGEKLRQYQHLPSVREVLFVSHHEPLLTVHRRDGGLWRVLSAGRGETVAIDSVGGRIAVDDVYRDGLEDRA